MRLSVLHVFVINSTYHHICYIIPTYIQAASNTHTRIHRVSVHASL